MHTSIQHILESNATTFRERNEIYALTENQVTQVESTMVSNLYRSAVEKSYIDFDDIPESKGDVTKYQGYKSMRESLSIIDNLAGKANAKVPELQTVNEALRTIESHRDYFIKGFLLNNKLVIMTYNSLVASCVEATSVLIASYVEFIRDPNKVEFKLVDTKHRPTRINLDTLEEFNKAAKSGKLTMLLKAETTSKDNFVGPAVAGSVLALGAAIAIIPIIREIIFGFYYSRVHIADYLDHQQELIKMNRGIIEASTLSAKEKRAVLAKQQKQADALARLSDKIRIETPKTQAKAKTELKQESKSWTLSNVQSQFASTDGNGFGLL